MRKKIIMNGSDTDNTTDHSKPKSPKLKTPIDETHGKICCSRRSLKNPGT